MLDALSFLKSTARGTHWAQLADYASPSLFRVVPLRPAIRQVRELAANTKNASASTQVRQAAASMLKTGSVPINLLPPRASVDATEPQHCSEEHRQALGRAALHLYFSQLRHLSVALLDLRLHTLSFAEQHEWVVWQPGPLFVRWQDEFIDGLRTLYAGFYENDTPQLERGLHMLGLQKVREPLLAHLGGADPTAMSFSMKAFHESFHSVFEACRDADVRLHPNFVPLGVLLACLYETLEKLELAFNVKAAYLAAA